MPYVTHANTWGLSNSSLWARKTTYSLVILPKPFLLGEVRLAREGPISTLSAFAVDSAHREARVAVLLQGAHANKAHPSSCLQPAACASLGPSQEAVPVRLGTRRGAGPCRRRGAGPRGRQVPLSGEAGGPAAGASAGDGRRCRSPRRASFARQRGGRAGGERGARRRSGAVAAQPASAAAGPSPPPPVPSLSPPCSAAVGERLRHRCPPRATSAASPRRWRAPAGHGALPAAPPGVLPLPGGGRGVWQKVGAGSRGVLGVAGRAGKLGVSSGRSEPPPHPPISRGERREPGLFSRAGARGASAPVTARGLLTATRAPGRDMAAGGWGVRLGTGHPGAAGALGGACLGPPVPSAEKRCPRARPGGQRGRREPVQPPGSLGNLKRGVGYKKRVLPWQGCVLQELKNKALLRAVKIKLAYWPLEALETERGEDCRSSFNMKRGEDERPGSVGPVGCAEPRQV